jgi:hypothetical protein
MDHKVDPETVKHRGENEKVACRLEMQDRFGVKGFVYYFSKKTIYLMLYNVLNWYGVRFLCSPERKGVWPSLFFQKDHVDR